MESNDDCPKTVLITGASGGLGFAYAEYFAKRGYHLILAGREIDEIESCAEVMRQEHGASADVLQVDLSDRKGLSILQRRIEYTTVDVLVNNATDEAKEMFRGRESAEAKRRMSLQMNTVVSLTLFILRKMICKNYGTIINISSDGSRLPSPVNAICNSSKMFIRQFTEGLHAELEDTKVSVQAVCPGFFRAQLWESSRQDKKVKYSGMLNCREREEVVEQLMQDLERGKIISSPGLRRGFLSRSSEDYLEKAGLEMNKIS